MDPTEACASCGRRIERRRAPDVRYCSEGCRRHKPGPRERALEERILALLGARPAAATICPSEVAREAAEDWRPWMEPVRRAARRLVARGLVEIRQKGRVVDPSTARGPIRLGRGPEFDRSSPVIPTSGATGAVSRG
jgi:predicted nucleic acid-binding Zn ribbon protein